MYVKIILCPKLEFLDPKKPCFDYNMFNIHVSNG